LGSGVETNQAVDTSIVEEIKLVTLNEIAGRVSERKKK
jgi:hypothetical protein